MPLAPNTAVPADPAVFRAVTLSAAPCGSLSLAITLMVTGLPVVVVAVPATAVGGSHVPVTTTVSFVEDEKPWPSETV